MEDKLFEEMRSQLGLLQTKLQKESIVNDRLLREVMRTKYDVINRQAWFSVACALFAMTLFVIYVPLYHLSLPFVIVTEIYMLVCVACTWYSHRDVRSSKAMNADMLTLVQSMRRLKRFYHLWLVWVTPTTLIPWLVWCLYEFTDSFEQMVGVTLTTKDRLYIIIPCLVGAAIGGTIGYIKHRKVVNTADEIIAQIEDTTDLPTTPDQQDYDKKRY